MRKIDIMNDLEKRQKYFTFLYPVILLPFIFYFIRLNWVYKNYQHNFFLGIIFFILLVVVPILYKFSKNLFLTLWIFYSAIIFSATFLIYIAGGYEAPGVFWISLIPVVAVALLGERGVLIGIIYTIFTALIYHLYPTPPEMLPIEFKNLQYYQQERTLNLNVFILFTLVFTYVYYLLEKKNNLELKKQKEKFENLLKVLFHDIANPALNIQLQAQRLQKKNIEEISTSLNAILNSSKSINQILDSVRSLKAFEDGKSIINFEWFSIQEAVKNALELCQEKIKDKNIQIDFPLNNSQFEVYGNQALFTHQVLINLLTNALKFTPENKKITIAISYDQEKGLCHLQMIDQGIGIPKDILENLFSDHHQTSRKGLKGEIGTGYGMPLVKFFVESFSGKLEIKSYDISNFPENSGTEISISLKAKT